MNPMLASLRRICADEYNYRPSEPAAPDAPIVVQPARRLLTIEDCTWREDPNDPRFGQVHRASWEAARAIVSNIGVTDAQRDFLLCCARQSAKTTTDLFAAIMCATEIPGSKTLYVSYDLSMGMEMIYEPIQRWLDKLEWPHKATASGPGGLRVVLDNGSLVQCRSADDLRAAGRLRGRGWHLILGDEVQDMLAILQRLFDEVLGPTTFRHSGATVMSFTPPDIQVGWLWDQWQSGRWKKLGWPMTENPFLPPGAAERWMAQRGITLAHPIARREVLGLWEPNTEKQVFEFNYQLNVYDPGKVAVDAPAVLPTIRPFTPEEWVFGFGGDIGWEHLSSVTFGAWNLHDPQRRVYEVLTLLGQKWLLDDWFKKLMDFRLHIGRRPFRSAIMDQAGAGAMNVIHSIEARFRGMGMGQVIRYKPANVEASVGLVNEHLRTGRLLLRRDSPLLEEFPKTVWAEGTKRVIDKAKFDPHGLDGLRYMVWGATNYRATQPPALPTEDIESIQRAKVTEHITRTLQRQQKRFAQWR